MCLHTAAHVLACLLAVRDSHTLLLGQTEKRRPPAAFAVWMVHEQVATAALECNATALAAEMIRAVLRRFPADSIRARRLQVRGSGSHGHMHTRISGGRQVAGPQTAGGGE